MSLTESGLEQAILAALAAHNVMTLATTGRDGPHAVSLMYACDGFDLYWLSDPATLHSIHLEQSHRCAVTISGQYSDFTAISGLKMQGHGVCLPAGNSARHGMRLLGSRYSFLREFSAVNLARHLGKAAIYRFRTDRITLIDNTRRFGFSKTLDCSGRDRKTDQI